MHYKYSVLPMLCGNTFNHYGMPNISAKIMQFETQVYIHNGIRGLKHRDSLAKNINQTIYICMLQHVHFIIYSQNMSNLRLFSRLSHLQTFKYTPFKITTLLAQSLIE